MEILHVIVYVFVLAELTIGWSPNPKKKFYRKLFDIRIYLLTFLGSLLLLLVPLYGLFYNRHFDHFYLAIPFFYLILFKIADGISLRVNKRHIIIAGRGDYFPKDHKWYIDSILAFTSLFGSIIIPILIREYVNN